MPFLRRLLSGDYRRAISAEAAGDYAEAARHYVLCGEREKVAEMHLLRSERVAAVAEKLDELRDALRWTDAGAPIRKRVLAALGHTLVKRARAEGATTVRDVGAVREAAAFLDEAGEHREAAEALLMIGDDEGAARAYERGGHVDELEEVLARERHRRLRADRVRDGFASYELALAGGQRDQALAELQACCEAADDKGEYRRLLEELRARLITAGVLSLRRRPDGKRLTISGADETRLGREPSSPLPLRDPGVSRAHVIVRRTAAGFSIRDAGSRTGTWLGGMRLDGEVPLGETTSVRLGDDTELSCRAGEGRLRLEVTRGLDRGASLVCVDPRRPLDLLAIPELAVPARLAFREGRPVLEAADLSLGGAALHRPAQLVRGDVVTVGAVELEVT